MVARSVASATVSFGLVSIPVKLYSSTDASSGVSFNMLHNKCKGRLKQQYICPRDDNEVVSRSDTVRGYEFAKDQYVVFTDEELKELQERPTQTVEITEFVPEEKVPPVYFEKSYYLGPDKGGERAYKLLAEAMRRTGRSAIAKYAARGKMYLVLVSPMDEGLVLYQLYYADEVRKFEDVPVGESDVKESELKLAMQLVEQIANDSFEPEKYRDEVKERIEEIIQKKVEGEQVSLATEEAPRAQIIDLMEALKASLGSGDAEAVAEESEEEEEEEEAPKAKAKKRAPKKKKASAG
jgi:DNA end-binding protein Ku